MSGREKTVLALHDPHRGRWALGLLIGLLCAIEVSIWGIGLLSGSMAGARSIALENGAFWPGLLWNWQPNYAAQPWMMFVTYGFLHGGIIHLAVNMIALWSLGLRTVERAGLPGFAAVYAASLVCGAAVFGLLATGPTPMVGASGALFGLAGAVLSWEYADRSAGGLSLWPVARAVGLLLGLNVVLWLAMQGLLAWQTHLGGFIAGWLVAMRVGRRGPVS